METAVSEVTALLSALYGVAALTGRGVVHVTSAVRAADGRKHVIKIGPDAPRSTTDFFVLNLCRARADAIVTSAAILRSEPGLSNTLQGPYAAALADYRRHVLGKGDPPVCAILTRSGDLPLDHPLWSDPTPKVVLTSPAAREALANTLGARAEVVGLDDLDARAAVAWLHARGLGLVSMEAGPSATAPLYGAPSVVTELLLSLYQGPLDAALLGKALPEDSALFAGRTRLADTARDEESGPWRFQRWLRDGAA